LFLTNLFNQCSKLKIIITTKKEIRAKEFKNIKDNIFVRKLKPLNDIEAVDLILSHVLSHRSISNEELYINKNNPRSVHSQM